MQKRKLGKTGLEVSALGYGCMELHRVDENTAGRLLNEALDKGMNYIDASPEYPISEYCVGKFISHRRDEVVIATKCCDNMSGEGATYIFDRKTIMENIEESLRLMKTDHVDVLQLHGVIPENLEGGEYGEAMEAMRDLKKAGKALHLGLTVCNKNPDFYGFPATYGYNSILRFAPWEDIEVIQVVYGGLTRISEDVIQKASDDYGTGVVTRGALKSYDATYAQRLEVARLDELYESGETRNDFLLRYVVSHPGIAVSVVGTKSLTHLGMNVKAAEKGPLSAEVYAEAKRRLAFAGVIPGPVDMKLDW